MAKATKKPAKAAPKRARKKVAAKKVATKKLATKKLAAAAPEKARTKRLAGPRVAVPAMELGATAAVLDRLWQVVTARRDADPAISHSARLLGRGTAKVAQKFGEEAVECLIEAVAGNHDALIAESADVLYHLLVVWVDAGIRPEEIWAELQRREGVSGIAEKASRARTLPIALGLNTTKIP